MNCHQNIPSGLKEKWKKLIDLIAEVNQIPVTFFQYFNGSGEFFSIHSKSNPLNKQKNNVAEIFTPAIFFSEENVELSKNFYNQDHSGALLELGISAIYGVPVYCKEKIITGTLAMFQVKKTSFTDKQKKNLMKLSELFTDDLLLYSDTEEKDNFMKNILEQARDIIYRMSVQTGKYEYINPACHQITGYHPEEFYNDPSLLSKIIHPDSKDYLDKEMEKLLKGDITENYDFRIINKKGEVRCINQRNVIVRDSKGNPIAIEGIASDFTEIRKHESLIGLQNELSLKLLNRTRIESILEAAFESVLQISGMDSGGIYLFDDKTGALEMVLSKGLSKKFVKSISSFPSESIPSKIVLKGEPVYGANPVLTDNEIVKSENLKVVAIIPINTSDKRTIGSFNIASHSISEIPVYTKEALETIVRQTGNAIERAKSHIKLEQSEERYRLLVENSPSVTWTADENGKIVFISSNIEKITGFNSEEMILKDKSSLFSLVYEPDLHFIQKAYKKLIKENIPFELDFRIRTKDGRLIWIQNKADIFKIEKEKTYAFGTFTDISNLKQVQIDLKNERDKARNYFNIAGVILISLDKNGKIEAINKKGCEILGYDEKAINGKNWFDSFIPAHNKKFLKDSFISLIRGDIDSMESYENLIINSKGEERLIAWSNTLIKDPEGNIVGTLSSGEDITERKQNQQKLFNAVIHAEEEERSRIAKDLHDGVSPVLSTLKLYVQSLVISQDDKIKETLISRISDTINETISSIKEISNNLSPHILHNFGYVTAIESFINRLKDIKHVNFEFKSDFEGRFDEKIEITLYRVTIELINNTLKHANANKILIVFNKNNNFVVHYEDDGKGFDPEKVIVEKRGMGLFNMKNRIESLNGVVNVTSKNGTGTSIDIIIPIND